MSALPLNLAPVNDDMLPSFVGSYRAATLTSAVSSADLTTDEYAIQQEEHNVRKTLDFIEPMLSMKAAKRVLDVGCGVGTMVSTLAGQGYEAYGVDLAGVQDRWKALQRSPERFFVVDALNMRLPFHDASLDFVFTLGVIEHVGTTDGFSDREPRYHQIREAWLRELFRVVRPGGAMLIGGPNKGFPIDVAHGPDTRASHLELLLSKWAGATVHKTWGENFLWGYDDIHRYLRGCAYRMTAQSVSRYVHYSRVPSLVRPLVQGYVKHLPKALLATGFNPWMAALVERVA